MKFKNLRRPAGAENSGVDVPPPTKARKLEAATVEASASDVAEYHEHIKQLKKSYSTQKWSVVSIYGYLVGSHLCSAEEVDMRSYRHSLA